ncbi:MAG TPA: hypothetical protein VFS43_33160 [Polyangiaceae bacterium]|nr:hypothetical protein [Polyangiaceae bacterium]
MSIVMTAGDVNSFFGEAVGSALSTNRVDASAGAKEYLVGVLVDYAQCGEVASMLKRPVALLLDEALSAPPAERFERLKGVGDNSLYVSGFFHEHLSARGVDSAYVARLGSTAYGVAAGMIGGGDGSAGDIFQELASKFGAFTRVLREVADAIFAQSARDAASLVKVYERWQRTGSERLGRALVAQGLLPVRPAGGVH